MMAQDRRSHAPPLRKVTAEMLAPHAVGRPLALHSERPGAYTLIAADPSGGVISVAGDAPGTARHEVISFRVVDSQFGPIRLVAQVLEQVALVGHPGAHVAVRWMAVTTTDRCRYMTNILGVLGIVARMPSDTDEIPMGRELVFDPETQQVRMIEVGNHRDRHPTASIVRGSTHLSGTQPNILVAASQPRPPKWNAPRSNPVPRPPTGTPVEMLMGRPLQNEQDHSPASTRRSNGGGRQHVDHIDAPAKRLSAARGRPTARSSPDPGPRRPSSGGTVPTRPSRQTGPRTPAPSAVSRLPEFRLTPTSAEIQVGRFHLPVVCVSVGQRSVSVIVEHGRNLPAGQQLHIGILVDQEGTALTWLEGVVDSHEASPNGGLRYCIRLGGTVPAEYRKLVQRSSLRR